MGYLHIDNLYKNTEILMFKECYALEKIHGTSAHISFSRKRQMVFGPIPGINEGAKVYTDEEWQQHWPDEVKITFFAGGVSHENFVQLFNKEELEKAYRESGIKDLTIYGEAYGGKCQGMSKTYGVPLKFVAFDVRVGEYCWLSVPDAENLVKSFNLEFVSYERIPAIVESIIWEKDKDSVQAVRNGMGAGHKREGVVLRPLIEVKKNNGARIIAKHKHDDFRETKTVREISPEALQVITDANKIADEWVVPMRIQHVLQKFPKPFDITQMGDFIRAMLADVEREAGSEIVLSQEAKKAISTRTATMIKQNLKDYLGTL